MLNYSEKSSALYILRLVPRIKFLLAPALSPAHVCSEMPIL